MKAPLNIHAPKNWQDFETLCLRLWGQIWNVPHDIDFNSDNSQGQQGVDIYAPIDDGLRYFGIQCKNKKLNLIDGSPNRLTIATIREEIEKAKHFVPRLGKLVIATSLPKDQKIEEFVRKQSVDNIENGFFPIQICFWEYIERKIIEFPEVYNWYIKNEDFFIEKKVEITFSGGAKQIICHPKFQKTIKKYILKKENEVINFDPFLYEKLNKKMTAKDFSKLQNAQLIIGQTIPWKQYCWMKLVVSNVGKAVIEDFKIELDFEGNFQRVGAEGRSNVFDKNFTNTVKEYSNSKTSLYIRPNNKILIQEDYFTSGKFFIEPVVDDDDQEIKINWKLISRDFTNSGSLLVRIEPKFHIVNIVEEVELPDEVREDVSVRLIERRGTPTIGGFNYYDKESDYNFE